MEWVHLSGQMVQYIKDNFRITISKVKVSTNGQMVVLS